jgi:regulator of sirC expression with transglutaminase-like and TPR domain
VTLPSDAHRLFARLASRRDEDFDLTVATLLVALEEYPHLSLERELARIESLASEVRRRLSGSKDDLDREIAILTTYLFVEQGFHGNSQEFDDPRNSFLNEVLDRKTGIPVTLSVLLIEVGRRAGVPLRGVGFPGHFLVRAERGSEVRILDAFDGGRTLSIEDCRERLAQLFHESIPFDETLLRPASAREILVRILTNLKHLYLRANDPLRAASAVDRILLLVPESSRELRDRGLLLGALGYPAFGVVDLERYLELEPQAADGSEIRRAAERMRDGKGPGGATR